MNRFYGPIFAVSMFAAIPAAFAHDLNASSITPEDSEANQIHSQYYACHYHTQGKTDSPEVTQSQNNAAPVDYFPIDDPTVKVSMVIGFVYDPRLSFLDQNNKWGIRYVDGLFTFIKDDERAQFWLHGPNDEPAQAIGNVVTTYVSGAKTILARMRERCLDDAGQLHAFIEIGNSYLKQSESLPDPWRDRVRASASETPAYHKPLP